MTAPLPPSEAASAGSADSELPLDSPLQGPRPEGEVGVRQSTLPDRAAGSPSHRAAVVRAVAGAFRALLLPATLWARARDCVERPELPSFDRVTVGKVGLARSPMGLFFGNPPPRPAGMRIPTRPRLHCSTFLKARSGPAKPRGRRSRPGQFLRRKSAVSSTATRMSCNRLHRVIVAEFVASPAK
jgi:hypothetical protein